MTDRVATRLAALARQLTRSPGSGPGQALAQTLPPATSATQEKRRLTYRRRVIRDNLRNAKALRERGTEVGWRNVSLTDEESQLADELARGNDASPHPPPRAG
jgi:hypothetical protein